MVEHVVSVTEVCIPSHGRGEYGHEKTLQGKQNILSQREGSKDKRGDSFI